MAYNANEVIEMALKRASLNNRDLVSDAQSRNYISSFERRAFIAAARANADFFGLEGTTSRSADGNSWDLDVEPGDVAAVTRVEISSITGTVSGREAGDEVSVIDLEYPGVEVPPRVYIRGRKIYEYNEELSTDGSNYVDTLKVFYSELPPRVVQNTQSLRLPEEWIDLVVVPLARVFALHDGRKEEAQILKQDHQENFQTFLQHVQIYNTASSGALRNRPSPIPADLGGGGE